ncbi:162_t:CDS:2 [Entrophospora sp. SA101]|nr:162_t:CDS:2 [Entrophospora sp. SA101]
MGLKEYDAVSLIIKETGIDMSIEDFLKERNQKQIEKFPSAKPLPGVMRLVKHLKSNNIPIVVATSSHKYNFEIKAKNNQELFSLFDSITCGDDPLIKHGKPSPDLFLLACERLGNPPVENCLVFEDAINGVKAALNAGMHDKEAILIKYILLSEVIAIVSLNNSLYSSPCW